MNQRKNVRGYYGQLYANNFDNLEVVDNFLKVTHYQNWPKKKQKM